MNFFKAIAAKIKDLVQRQNKQDEHKPHAPKAGHVPARKLKNLRTVKLAFLSGGRKYFFGPVFPPSRENHHASRQTCRAYLRGLFFAQASARHPEWDRRTRREFARFAAKHEYRVMMNDITNRIPDSDAAVAPDKNCVTLGNGECVGRDCMATFCERSSENEQAEQISAYRRARVGKDCC